MTSPRDVVLGRIRAALAAAPPAPVEVPRDYRRAGELPAGSPRLVDLFTLPRPGAREAAPPR